jgi:Zn-dependent protease with chaperone function
MTLTQEQFDSLVHQLERYAGNYPRRFKQRVALLAVLGYSYIVLILVFILWLIFTISSFRLGDISSNLLILVAIVFGMAIIIGVNLIRALWVRIPKPEGRKLYPRDAPELFKFVNKLASTLKAPKFDEILLTKDLNAAILQIPRLSIFGWYKNYLIIGLPLMQALTIEEFRAVIAHELGHLSGKHSAFAGWIYRVYQVWVRLLIKLQKQKQKRGTGIFLVDIVTYAANGLSFLLFDLFFDWFASIFTVYSFVLARSQEYEADRYSASLVGAEHIAGALIKIYTKSRYIERNFWLEIYKQADHNPQQPEAISLMFQALQAQIPDQDYQRWLKASLVEKTDTQNTHPCLSQRLTALGFIEADYIFSQMAHQKYAAQELFSQKTLDKLTVEMNQEWKNQSISYWQGRMEHLQDINPKLGKLQEKAKTQILSIDEQWKLSNWTAEIEGDAAAIPLLENLLARQSYHAPANLLLGKILLNQNDESGIRHIESAIKCDNELGHNYQVIIEFLYYEQGDTDKVKYYQQQLEQHYYRTVYGYFN